MNLEAFLSQHQGDEYWGTSDLELSKVAEAAGTEPPAEWASFFAEWGGQDRSSDIERVATVEFSTNDPLVPASAVRLGETTKWLNSHPISDELGVPLFPVGTIEGLLVFQAGREDDGPILALSPTHELPLNSARHSVPRWYFIAQSLRDLLDTWILPEELGRWQNAQHSDLAALELLVDRSSVFEREKAIWQHAAEIMRELVVLPELFGQELMDDLSTSRLTCFTGWWFNPAYADFDAGRLRVPIFHLRSRLGGIGNSVMAVACALVCGGSVRDDVGFLGAEKGIVLDGAKARDVLFELNQSGDELEPLIRRYRRDVCSTVNREHRYGLSG